MMRAQQSFGAGLILTIGGVCKGCHHRPSCRPIIIITRNNSERSGIETLVIILITIVVVVLSLSLYTLTVARKKNNFSRLFLSSIWKHQSSN
jgi:heme/copper-type cytochrome/quinol oxidase subunit 2